MNIDVLTFDVQGTQFAGVGYGPCNGTPVLALHGWLDNAASFCRLAPLLSGCRVVAIDQRGHGMSNHAGRPYYIWDSVPDMICVLDALGWEKAIILGHSMGAAVATLFAGTFSERVIALWLLEGLGPWIYPNGTGPDLLRESIRKQRSIRKKKKPWYPTVEDAVRARVKGGVVTLTESAADPIVRRGLIHINDGYTWASDQYLTLPPMFRLSESQIRVFIEHVRAPISLVLGSRGFFQDPQFLSERIEICADVRVEIFDGGHHLHLEGAECVIARWLLEGLEQ
ncbi:alpha/beta hydrolase [Litorivicinus sp.]|nr:alpha/beta hydrolase [Litorivicinus sp.]